MDFVIEPHRGIGPVSFGMTRAEVAAVVAAVGGGPPSPRNADTDCFFNSSFQVTFGDGGRADFIEVASDLPVPVLFEGRDVRDTPASELVALIERLEPYDPGLSRPEDEYVFPHRIITLWGPDTQYDRLGERKRVVFAAVGLGAPNYLAAARAIRGA